MQDNRDIRCVITEPHTDEAVEEFSVVTTAVSTWSRFRLQVRCFRRHRGPDFEYNFDCLARTRLPFLMCFYAADTLHRPDHHQIHPVPLAWCKASAGNQLRSCRLQRRPHQQNVRAQERGRVRVCVYSAGGSFKKHGYDRCKQCR